MAHTEIAVVEKSASERLATLAKTWDDKVKDLHGMKSMIPDVLARGADESDAADVAKLAKGLKDEIEDARTGYTEPINAVLKIVNGVCKPRQERLTEIVDEMKLRLGRAAQAKRDEQDRLRREADEAERKRLAELETAKPPENFGPGRVLHVVTIDESSDAVSSAPALVRSPDSYGKATTGWKWAWRVTDMALVPREYLCIDEEMLNVKAKAKPAPVPIPGIEFFSIPNTRIR